MNKSNQERRLTSQLIKHWEGLVQKCGSSPPLIDSLNPKIIWNLWEQCLHLELLSSSKTKFNITHIGGKLLDLIPQAHERLTVLPSDRNLPYHKLLQLVEKNLSITTKLFEGTGNLINNHTTNEEAKLGLKYRSCILPFCSISGKVNNFVVGISYKKERG